ncbi:MAG: hypothetical protein U0354_17945 [Candidatus Sericytochromatia bacterium]
MPNDININFDMSYSIDNDSLRAYPNNKNSMLLGILHLQEYLKLLDNKDAKEKAKLLSKISYYQKLIGNYIDSEKNQLKSIKIFEKIDDKKSRFISLIRLAQIYQFKNNYDKSTEIFNQLELEIDKDKNLDSYRDFLYQHIGKNEFEKKNYKLALDYFYKALDIRNNKGDNDLIESTKLAINRLESFINL